MTGKHVRPQKTGRTYIKYTTSKLAWLLPFFFPFPDRQIIFNFDFTRKISNFLLGKKNVKMQRFCPVYHLTTLISREKYRIFFAEKIVKMQRFCPVYLLATLNSREKFRIFLRKNGKIVKTQLFCPVYLLATLISREKFRVFYLRKKSWKRNGFALFTIWQLWFHEKTTQFCKKIIYLMMVSFFGSL